MLRPTPRSSYTPQDLENALVAIIDGVYNVRQSALRYGIPYETLRVKAMKRRSAVAQNLNTTRIEKVEENLQNIMQIVKVDPNVTEVFHSINKNKN